MSKTQHNLLRQIERNDGLTYHKLGIIAQEQHDFDAAETWYRKSLEIKEKQGNEHGTASTYGQLGILAGLQESFEEAGQWLIKSIVVFSHCNKHYEQIAVNNFMIFYNQSPPETQQKLKTMWEKALGEFPEGA